MVCFRFGDTKMIRFLVFISVWLFAFGLNAQEICNNGIDDDSDGMIDLNDPDCSCNGTPITPASFINPSFENRSCCPTNSSQTNCIDDWDIPAASIGTPDYYNTCGMTYFPFPGSVPPPTPLPDGDGYIGFFNKGASKEYLRNCLNGTINAGDNYTCNFYLSRSDGATFVEVALYGLANCNDNSFSGFSCPQAGSNLILLGTVTVNMASANWELGSITFTAPSTINALVFGPSCTIVADDDDYYFADDFSLTLNNGGSTPIDTVILTQSGDACSGPITLNASTTNTGGTYQWYIDGVAITTPSGSGPTANTYTINSLPSTPQNYSVKYENGSGCAVSNPIVVVKDSITWFNDVRSVCTGSSLGSITVYNVNGGSGNYTYQLDANPPGSDTAFYNLTSAQYFITVADNNGCSSTDAVFIPTTPSVTANFEADSVCFGNPTSFTNTSTSSGLVSGTYWDFGGGNTSINPSPTYTFGSSGTSPVTFVATTDLGCSDTITKNVFVSDGPSANFSVIPSCSGDSVRLTNLSTFNGSPYDNTFTFNWDFGDGNTSTSTNPAHLYSSNGNYTITLTATQNGCSGDTSIDISIGDAPQANFTYTAACEGDSIQFQDASTIGSGTIVSYLWLFSPTDSSTLQNPSFAYTSGGPKTVQLTVTADNGCSHDTSVTVTVNPLPKPNFNFDPTCANMPMNFYDISSVPTGSITNYQWDFDGLGNASVANPTFTFTNSGLFDVTLSATSDQGCVDSIVKRVVVTPAPTASFDVIPSCPNTSVPINNTTNTAGAPYDNTYSFNWDFGNGSSSTDDSPSQITYSTPGVYTINLTTVTSLGCTNDTAIDITIFDVPTADFIADTACLGDPTNFTDVSTVLSGSITLQQWIFGEFIFGGNSTSYTFDSPQNQSTTLIVTSSDGCTDTITKPVYIEVPPVADFEADTYYIDYVSNMVNFNNTSQGASTYSWEFGSLGNSTDENPSFEFIIDEPCQTWDVTLEAISTFGCTDTNQQAIQYQDNIIVYAPNSFTPNGDGKNDVFEVTVFGVDVLDNLFTLTIFDRWGEEVFSTNELDNFWDGYVDGSLAPTGAYIWRISAKQACGADVATFNGHVLLIK